MSAAKLSARSGEMSRIGKMPIPLPSGVTVKVENGLVQVKGSKGELSTPLLEGMTLTQESEQVVIERASDSRQHRAIHGLMRRLVANMVEGVSSGFDKKLEIQGVGYRAEAKGNVLNLTLGYSHPIAYQLPEGISAKVDGQTAITISSFCRLPWDSTETLFDTSSSRSRSNRCSSWMSQRGQNEATYRRCCPTVIHSSRRLS
jgi:large subunit ribosomal protein L6